MLWVLKRTISNKVSWVRSFVVTLCSLGYLSCFLSPVDFYKINFFKKFFKEYHLSVKQIGFNLFEKFMSRRHWLAMS